MFRFVGSVAVTTPTEMILQTILLAFSLCSIAPGTATQTDEDIKE